MTQEKQSSSENKYLEFSLGEEHYALPLLFVREVIASPKTTPIPNSPAHFVGIMNLRGQVISILDLRKKLSIKSKTTQDTKQEAVIIIDAKNSVVGVLVDAVSRVISIPDQEIDSTSVGGSSSSFINGIYKSKEYMVVLPDLIKIFDLEAAAKKKVS